MVETVGWERISFLNRLSSLVGGKRGRGPRRRLEDSVRNDLDVRDLGWEEAQRDLAKDRGRRRRVVKGGVDGRTTNMALAKKKNLSGPFANMGPSVNKIGFVSRQL